jgi:hypothetical protein
LSRRFTHPTLGAITLNSAADLAGCGEAYADTRLLVGPAQSLNGHGASRQRPTFGAGQKLPTFLKPVDGFSWPSERKGYGLTNLWRRGGDRIGFGRRRFRR